VPYRPDGDFLQDDDLSRWDETPQEPEGGGWWKWAVAFASLALFGGVVWYAYNTGAAGPTGPVRTVEADSRPYKAKPEHPGGEIIPDQDKLVFNEAVGRTSETEDILGDGPEMPQAKPEPVPVRKYAKPAPLPAPDVPDETLIAEATPQDAISEDGAADTPPPATAMPEVPAQAAPPPAASALVKASEPPPAAAPPVQEAKPAQPSGGKPAVVQLGAYGSHAGAMEAWAEVQRKHGAVVASLSPQIVKINVSGKELHRLVIGSFADRSAAAQVCTQLKSQGRDCIVNAN